MGNDGTLLLFATTSRLALGPIQPPTQWILGALALGVLAART